MIQMALSAVALWLYGAGGIRGAAASGPADPAVTKAAMELLRTECLACHAAAKSKGGLVLETRAGLVAGGDTGPVFDAAHPQHSRLLAVLAADADPHMPPKKQLTAEQVELFKRWLGMSAPWDDQTLHQATAPPVRDVPLLGLPPAFQPVLAIERDRPGTRWAVAVGSTLRISEAQAPQPLDGTDIGTHLDLIRALAWSDDGQWLASGSFREVALWHAPAFERVRVLQSGLTDRIGALCFIESGLRLLAADGAPASGGLIHCIDVGRGEILFTWQAHAEAIYGLTASRDGRWLASASADRQVKLWDMDAVLAAAREPAPDATPQGARRSRGARGRAAAPIVPAPALRRIEPVAVLEGHGAAVLGVAFHPDGKQLASAGSDKQVKVWDVATRHNVLTLANHKHGLTAVRWADDGLSLVVADEGGRVVRYSDLKGHTGEQSSGSARDQVVQASGEGIAALAVNADATRVWTGSSAGRVQVLERSGKVLATRTGAVRPGAGLVPGERKLSFLNDVLPLLSKAGCNAGACHAKAEGQAGFKLTVFSYDPMADHREIVEETRGRRVFPASPAESLLLLKPTMAVEHGGGRRLERDSSAYRTLEAWIRQGMPLRQEGEPTLERVEATPSRGVYAEAERRQLTVHAVYSDGSRRDVTELADFTSSDVEIVRVGASGEVTVGRQSGEAVVVARFMGRVDAARITVPVRGGGEASLADFVPRNFVDELARAEFGKLGLTPTGLCTDAEFARRSSLDAIGVLPDPAEVRTFLEDSAPDKRERWVERLLESPAYADHWAGRWADLVRPNPDRVGVKSVYVLDQWLRASFAANKPYDALVREVILAEGSNHETGPLTIYRDRREPPELATLFSQVFLGIRMECAKCHHHPNEKWAQEDFYQFAAFFGSVKQKGAGLSPPISAGTESFYHGPGGEVRHPVTGEVMRPRPLDGTTLEMKDGGDPRVALADWMTGPGRRLLARALVNRVWAVFFGRGFVEPVDDFRVSNPVVHEPLLDALAKDFADHGYDMKRLMRTIMDSRLYQLSSEPGPGNRADTRFFSRSYRRRLAAEVLLDAVQDVTGVPDTLQGVAPGARAARAWTYKIPSHFMDAFGRPNSSSDCPCERDPRTSVVQSLHLMNAGGLQAKLAHADGRVRRLTESRATPAEVVTELYLAALSRPPGTAELEASLAVFARPGVSRQEAAEDVLWALLNSAEFVFNH